MLQTSDRAPAWARCVLDWLLGIGIVRAKSRTLRNAFIAGNSDDEFTFCSWKVSEDGALLLDAIYRPKAEHMAELLLDQLNGERRVPLPWRRFCDARLVVRLPQDGEPEFLSCLAKTSAALKLQREVSRISFDRVDVARAFGLKPALTN